VYINCELGFSASFQSRGTRIRVAMVQVIPFYCVLISMLRLRLGYNHDKHSKFIVLNAKFMYVQQN